MKKIIIIGGGAAGMMAACFAAGALSERGNASVQLFEKNAYLGAKVLISGGGRCNVTTGIFDVRELLKNYPRGAKFLMTAMFRMSPEKVMAWFEDRGVRLKIEKDFRVFPVSDNGKDIVGVFEKELQERGVEVFCDTSVVEVSKNNSEFCVTTKEGRKFFSDVLILTTGGNAYRHTGSTGDGYAFAQALGHTITPLGPSLNSFLVSEKFVRDLAGVSFEKVGFSLLKNDEMLWTRDGAFVFTHRGVSGPAIFALSSFAAYETISVERPLQLKIDFFPDEKFDAFERRVLDLIQKNPQKSLVNFLDIVLPKSLCGVIPSLVNIAGDTKAGSLTKEQRAIICSLLKNFSLTVIGRSGGEEFVTAGGVNLAEVNTNTMESKICPGLYFAGEILDIDGFTGGFNLQASWAMGALAGSSAAEEF